MACPQRMRSEQADLHSEQGQWATRARPVPSAGQEPGVLSALPAKLALRTTSAPTVTMPTPRRRT